MNLYSPETNFSAEMILSIPKKVRGWLHRLEVDLSSPFYYDGLEFDLAGATLTDHEQNLIIAWTNKSYGPISPMINKPEFRSVEQYLSDFVRAEKVLYSKLEAYQDSIIDKELAESGYNGLG